jgi:pyruvate dehydrogenase E2 component (dihydrolipoamide acetyltransferase)
VLIPSPFGGTIDKVAVRKGKTVQVGDLLLTFKVAGSESSPPTREREGQGADLDSGAEKRAAREKSGEKPASPATRRLARELGVDLNRVKGSGPGGRVESSDLREAAAGGTEQASDASEQASGQDSGEARTFDFDKWGEVETLEPSATRRRIAEKMVTAWQKVPHVMHADFVDVSRLEDLRSKHAEQFREEGVSLPSRCSRSRPLRYRLPRGGDCRPGYGAQRTATEFLGDYRPCTWPALAAADRQLRPPRQ